MHAMHHHPAMHHYPATISGQVCYFAHLMHGLSEGPQILQCRDWLRCWVRLLMVRKFSLCVALLFGDIAIEPVVSTTYGSFWRSCCYADYGINSAGIVPINTFEYRSRTGPRDIATLPEKCAISCLGRVLCLA